MSICIQKMILGDCCFKGRVGILNDLGFLWIILNFIYNFNSEVVEKEIQLLFYFKDLI